jgi:magnesium transporter
MIRTALYDPQTDSAKFGGEELVSSWQGSSNDLIWIDIGDESPEHENEIFAKFAIHRLAIQDAQRERHPPKIEAFENFLFVLLRGLDATTTTIDFGVIQLSLFIGERFLITRHNKPSMSANWLFEQVEQSPEWLAEGSGSLAVRLSDRLQRRYVQILLDLEPRLDAVEDEMFARPNDAQLAELTGYKSKLRQLARIARYHQHVATELKRSDSTFMPDGLNHELTDFYEQTERSQSLADLYYQTASDLTDSYLALSSHRLNNVMQILTIITVIFVPLTFLAGIYGMNFMNMPELATENGYFVVIGVMLIVGIWQLILFKRKGWM